MVSAQFHMRRKAARKNGRFLAIERAPARFIQVNDDKRFDPIKTCTLTGTFKIWIAAGVNPGLSPLNYPFKGDKK